MDITTHGPCFVCGIETEYEIYHMHRRYGDKYLVKLFELRTPTLDINHCGRLWDKDYLQLSNYMCSECKEAMLYVVTALQSMTDIRWRLYQERLQGEQDNRRSVKRHKVTSLDDLRKEVYAQFLSSDYWKAVKELVLERTKNKCENCGNSQDLQIHHNSYSHHGLEHLYLDDLTCLCEACHKHHHGIAQ